MPETAAQYLNLPFDEAISFFRGKVNLPTKGWDDLMGEMHARAFVVAGATKTELLSDLRGAVDKAVAEGTTLAAFRKDFDAIVGKHGWKYKGSRGWRSAVIYDTNLATAYAAGRYKGLTDPAVLAVRPYWWYLPSTSINKRADHRPFYNLVLRHDDPFWDTHYPPNGWGCKCGLRSLSSRELERYRQRYGIKTEAPELGEKTHINRTTGEQVPVPAGIDPGFDYNPGKAAWGARISAAKMDEYRAMESAAWLSLTPGDWQSFGLPEKLTTQVPIRSAGAELASTDEAAAELKQIIGGEEKVFSFTGDKGFRYDLLVNAKSLAEHIKDELWRTPYLPLVPEVLSDPEEVWIGFQRHKGTGKTALRMRVIKALKLGKKRTIIMAFDAVDGWLTSWTIIPSKSGSYVNKQREGWPVYRKEK